MDNLTAGIYRIEANRTVKDAISEGLRRQSTRQHISVTDLVNPMQAYFQRTRSDIEIPMERLQLILTGTGFHSLFGAAVSTEEYLEQFVEKDGVVGRIDIYESVPVEVKTTNILPEDLRAQRQGYIEQLAMYCYMASNPNGIVVVYRRADFDREPALRAYRVSFRDLDTIGKRMQARKELLEDALAGENPQRLGRCEWFNRGCDYQHVCVCADVPASEPLVRDTEVEAEEDEGLTGALLAGAVRWRHRPTWAVSFNDLVFPRRGVLLRTVGRTEPDAEEGLQEMQRGGFMNALSAALRHGEPGAFSGKAYSLDAVRGIVRFHRGIPTILRTTRTRDMIERDRLFGERPFWFDRLALEAALAESETGRLIVYYPRVGNGDHFMVYDVAFRDLDKTLVEARSRIERFARRAPPEEFPVCGPSWMSDRRYCPFRDNCACR